MKFKFLEHKADAKFRAYGKSLEECFINAALAMTSVMTNYEKIKPNIKEKITVEGIDLKNLLYNFLEELLFLLDTKNFILNKIEKIKIKGLKLEAVLVGDNLDHNYEVKSDVKAVTYNEMEIKQKPFMVQVVVDI